MQIVFIHPNYPAQFGHIAQYLTRRGHEAIFVTQATTPGVPAIRRITYQLKSGATDKNHYCSRTFENTIWSSHAVYETLAAATDLQPDLIVAHSGFGTTLFLPELFDCPIINYFEWFYHAQGFDLDFRTDYPVAPIDRLRARARNAMLLLDLQQCQAGYSPTYFQRSVLPNEYLPKIEVLFDGIDATLWQPGPEPNRRFGDWELPRGTKLVTYATRGMEAMRGFDLFIATARELLARRPDIHIAIAGQDRVCYGGDTKHLGGKTLKETLFASPQPHDDRIHFLGWMSPADLARLFRLSHAHLYWSVPFVLSWSVFNALACGVTLIASDTAPLREVVQPGRTGLLVDFMDVDAWVEQTLRVLERPEDFAPLGIAARQSIAELYSYDACLPRIERFYQRVAARITS